MSRRPAPLLLAAALALAAVAPGCASAGHQATTTTTTAPVTAPPTTAPPTTVRPKPSRAARGFPTSDEAVNTFMDDWLHNRKADLYQIADAAAVVGVYQSPNGPPSQDRGCEEPSIPGDTLAGCNFLMAGEQGILQVSTEQRPIGWVVIEAVYQPCTTESPCV